MDPLLLTSEQKKLIDRALPAIAKELPAVVTEFYAWTKGDPMLSAMISKSGRPIDELARKQSEHWMALLRNGPDEAFRQRAAIIGKVHHKIGLTPHWYMAGYAFILQRLNQLIGRRHRFSGADTAQLISAVTMVLMFDMQAAISVYAESSAGTKTHYTLSLSGVTASLQDILRRFLSEYDDFALLPQKVAIQMNDTHPALAGPELIRLLTDVHGLDWDRARDLAQSCLNYTNHTLLPEALETWSTWLMGNVLPRHMQIIERIDADHRKATGCADDLGIVHHDQVHMGTLAFVMASHVNGVSALHSDLMKRTVFAGLDGHYPGRILNQTNGVTPRRWLRMANPGLARVLTDTIGAGWENDLSRLEELRAHEDDRTLRDAIGAAKRANKVALSNWAADQLGVAIDPDAMFDVQVKRMHEYKRQLMNLYETVARWQAIRANPEADWTPRVKIFGGKAAPGYAFAKDVIRLINDAARVINADPVTGHLLKVLYPANYNVSMAERLIPAADLSEQISTAGKEASGTGNMKFTLNGALTIGTLDGANVEIREQVGAENFFLFGMSVDEAQARAAMPDHARKAIHASQPLQDVLQAIVEGTFSPKDTDRYNNVVDTTWNHDTFLVASDFDSYRAAQAEADAAFRDADHWNRLALRNIAGAGHFSSDRTIRGYMKDVWHTQSLA